MFFYVFLATILLTVVTTLMVRAVALRFNIVDVPTKERKIHTTPIPLLGGVALYLSFSIIVLLLTHFSDQLVSGYLLFQHIIGILIAGGVLILGGIIDDIKDLPAKLQITFPLVATFITIVFGIEINSLTNPFGGTFYFNSLVATILTFCWLMGMMYTTKYLDGSDGLVAGVSLIASMIIFFVAQDVTLKQEYIALLSIVAAGIFCGFLFFNFNPASIFLGESGSLFAGYLIGVLSILSGSKIATALLVFGIPILDVIWVIGRRIATGQKIYQGDKMHLHHRLLALGFTQKQIALILYTLCLIFGSTSLFLQTKYKLFVLIILILTMTSLAIWLVSRYNATGRSKL